MHQRFVDNKRVEDRAVWTGHQYLVKKVEEKCNKRSVLAGTYFVGFIDALPNLSKHEKKNIEEQLIAYVAETQADYQAEQRSIVLVDLQICTIVKINNMGLLSGIYVSSNILRGGENSVPLYDQIREKVAHKAELLEGFTQPRILLLDEQGYLERPGLWFDCLVDYAPAKRFHTIYIIRSSAYDFAIQVGEEGWSVLRGDGDMPTFKSVPTQT